MQKWKKWLIGVMLTLGILGFAPLLIPMQTYTREIETHAASALGAPVHIGNMHVALLPTPRLNADDVQIGNKQELTVMRLAILPDITTLFSDRKVISSVRFEQAAIKKSLLDIFANMSNKQSDKTSPTSVNIRELYFHNSTLLWPDVHLPPLNAIISLNADNKPRIATLESTDGKLKLNLTPEEHRQIITIEAKSWALPVGTPLLFNELHAEMILTDDKLDISKIVGVLYGGSLQGEANLIWGKTCKLTGKLKLDGIAVQEPAQLLSKSTRVSGQLSADGSFIASAKNIGQLTDNLQATIPFKVQNGILYGFNLAEAPLMLVGKGKGGETQFDAFSGVLAVSGKSYHFRDLDIRSGLMSASGQVKINPNKTLNGEVDVEVKNSMQLASIPLEVSGDLQNPKVFPTKAAIAGAVAGTAVLGPAGTGLGLKAGKAMDKLKGLFGN